MLNFKNELDIFLNEKFRASSLVFEMWSKIESDILYSLGMSEEFYLTVYFDNDIIMFTATSLEYVISTKNIKFSFIHTLTLLTDFSITLNAKIKRSKDHKVYYDKKSFMYDHNSKEDEGEVDVQCEIHSDLSNYNEIKMEMICSISKELQYAVNRNVLERKISDNVEVDIDANFEVVRSVANIKNISLKEASKEAYNKKYFNIFIFRKLNELIERLEICKIKKT